MKRFLITTAIAAFLAGVVTGGYLFSQSQPRSFLAVPNCNGSCYHPNELAGLLVSAGIQRVPGLIPNVVKETDKCIAIAHPFPEIRHHFVIFPKRDIKNIADVTVEDQPFLLDCINLMRVLIAEQKLRNYRVSINGPGLQDVTYLHFHLTSK